MVKDLHEFLERYGHDFPDEVVRVSTEISARHEVSAIVAKLGKKGRAPILIFDNIKTDSGKHSKYPLITNLVETRKRLAYALGSTFENVGLDYYDRVANSAGQTITVSQKQAPVKEVVKKGSDVDLFEFPALVHHNSDPGPYISAGYLTTYYPESSIENSGIYRGWIRTPREIGVYMSTPSHGWVTYSAYEEKGEEMKAAYWIGHHPTVMLGCNTKFGFPKSHYAAAGAAAQEPLRVVPSETLGREFLVPADAEIIIEGTMRPYLRKPEGPFGEYPGYAGPQKWNPSLEVTAVTHRRNAFWVSYHPYVDGNVTFGTLAQEAVDYLAVKRAVPAVKRCFVSPMGAGRFHLYIQMKKTLDGQPRDAILAALGSSEYTKHVFVFDEDVDIFDERSILWAIATRSQWDRDLVVVSNCLGPSLDPTVEDPKNPITAKAGLDCTKPLDKPFAEVNAVPDEVLNRIKLEDYIDAEKVKRMLDVAAR